MTRAKKDQWRTRNWERISLDDFLFEREQCAIERAKLTENGGNGERYCQCAELIIGGKRIPCPKHHDCRYVAQRSALVAEASKLATKKIGDPTNDKERGYTWTKIFNAEMDRLSAPLLNGAHGNGANSGEREQNGVPNCE
jgi:hypothetical protein